MQLIKLKLTWECKCYILLGGRLPGHLIEQMARAGPQMYNLHPVSWPCYFHCLFPILPTQKVIFRCRSPPPTTDLFHFRLIDNMLQHATRASHKDLPLANWFKTPPPIKLIEFSAITETLGSRNRSQCCKICLETWHGIYKYVYYHKCLLAAAHTYWQNLKGKSFT